MQEAQHNVRPASNSLISTKGGLTPSWKLSPHKLLFFSTSETKSTSSAARWMPVFS